MAQKSLISFFIVICFFLVLLFNLHLAIAETSEKSGPQEVLIVHSDYQGYPWTDSLNVGIKNVVSSSPLTINLQFEYLDSKRNRAEYYFEQLRELWNIKYDKRHIDLIIVCSNEAYDFVMLERNNLFLGIPIVFTSYIGFTAEMLNGKQPITGVVQETDIISTIDTALRLHPQTKKIVFVAPGAPPFRLAWLEGLEERYAKIVQIHTIIAETTAQIDKEINSVGEDIVVIPLNSVLESDGIYLPFGQFVSHLSIERPFPVYALWDIALGQGVVGGKMVSGTSQGKEAAKQALQILQGSPVSDVPVVTDSPNQYLFDWEAMKRFKISDNDLPPKSIVINRPITFYAENKTIAHVTIIIFVVLFLLILSLFVAIIYLRRTQKDLLVSDKTLKASESRFEKLIQKSPLPMVITDRNQDISFFNDKFTELFGYTIEDISTAEEWWCRAYPDQVYREKVQNSWLIAIEKASATATDIGVQEWDLTIKNGSTRKCEFFMVPLEEVSLIIMNDITEQKIAENALIETAEILKEAQRVARIGSWRYDPVSQMPTWTDEMFHIFGLEPQPEALPYEEHRKIIHPDDWDRFDAAVNKAVSSGIGYNIEIRITRPSGELIYVNARCEVKKCEFGKVIELIGTTQDITDRKLAEIDLRKSEERYKNFFNDSPVPLWEEDFTEIFQIIEKMRARGIKNFRDFFNQNPLVIEECIKKVKILDVNKASCQLHDAQNKDHLIGNLDKIFSDNSIVAFKEELIKIAEGKKNIEVAGEVKTLNGEIKFVDIRLNIHERTPGSFVALISTVDVTNRKQVEDKLRKNESLLQRIFDILPIGLWIADKDGKLLQGNLAGVEIWGAEPHVGPEDYGVFRARRLPSMAELAPEDWALTHTITKGVTITDELLEIDTFDGRKKTILNYTAPVLDSFNKVEGAVIVNLDISQRVSAEKDAIQSKVRLNTVINTIPDMIWLKDEDGIYLSCNPTFERFFGAKESEIVGKTDYDFVDKELADFFRKNDSKALKIKTLSINEEWLTFRDDGYNGLFETIKLPVYDPNGELVGILGIARDITKRHNAEKEKITLVRQLKQSQKMESIGKLAGGIAHDFNNILTSVLGFSELALDECEKGSTMEDNLQEIYAGGMRAKEIVKQILAFARQSDEELKPTRVDTIVIEALKLIRPTTPTTIDIRQEIASSSLVMGNTTQIHQIILNLCTNAAHAMEDNGGIMEVTLKDVRFGENIKIPGGLDKGKYIELAISDTGSGIEPEHIDSIFDPYFTTKEMGKGTGMGLAMVRGITESYGGTILVESSPLVKTRFTLYLPITSNLDNEITFEPKTLPKGDEHILFVDDEPPIARMGSRTLESLGYKVTTRTSSIEALELFKAKPDDFQLVITDMTMAHMTGDKFAIELKQIRADIPIILCTGYSNKINAEIAQEIGINAFTYKPFSKADLARCVREVLDKV